jgi:transcriptional regulator with XRE-family HTH domain
MKRGRRRDDYPQTEFRGAVLGTLTRRNFSLRALETLSGVNRGTLSAVLHGKRPCEREDRAAIMHALGFGSEIQIQFLSDVLASAEHDRILLDGRISADPQLQRGQLLMSRAQFAEAHHQFRGVFDMAVAAGDALGQAEAAGWLGWFHGELEHFRDSLRWTAVSISTIESHLGMSTDEITHSVTVSQSLSSTAEKAAQVLSRALRVRSKVLAVRIVHHLEFDWLAEAKQHFRQSVELDERLEAPELAHDLRWKAVAMSAEDRSHIRDIERLLYESRERLPSGGPAEACLIREQGIIRWQKNRLAKAADFLWEAKEKLAFFADARALGPTFCVLSKLIIQDSGDFRRARHYAVVAAGLHPYGYVLDHCVDQLRNTAAVERQRDLDDLRAGQKPFDIVHRVMASVASGSPNTSGQLVEHNVGRIRAALLPSAGPELPAPVTRSR